MNAKILPYNKVGVSRTATIEGLSREEIQRIIGFEPNCEDDPVKVGKSWGFTVDGYHCGVWSYNGSGDYGVWSAYGFKQKLEEIFGEEHVY